MSPNTTVGSSSPPSSTPTIDLSRGKDGDDQSMPGMLSLTESEESSPRSTAGAATAAEEEPTKGDLPSATNATAADNVTKRGDVAQAPPPSKASFPSNKTRPPRTTTASFDGNKQQLPRRPRGQQKQKGLPFPTLSLSPTPSFDQQLHEDSSPLQRIVALLNSDPRNKVCADCRTPMLNRSQTYASFHTDPFAEVYRGKAKRDGKLNGVIASAGIGEAGGGAVNDQKASGPAGNKGKGDRGGDKKAVISGLPSPLPQRGAASLKRKNSTTSVASFASAKTVRIGNKTEDCQPPPWVVSNNPFADFKDAHASMAPPAAAADSSGGGKRTSEEVPPEVREMTLTQRALHHAATRATHGVFICPDCASAHRALGAHITTVKGIVQGPEKSDPFTAEDVAIMEAAGGNARAKSILEQFMCPEWTSRIPRHSSGSEERQVFARAKYEAYAFAFPRGPANDSSWWNLLGQNAAEAIASSAGGNLSQRSTSSAASIASSASGASSKVGVGRADKLPPRLVDYFCVVGPTGRLHPAVTRGIGGKVTNKSAVTLDNVAEVLKTNPWDVLLEPKVLQCYPDQSTHRDMVIPTHLAKFLFPDGCRPSLEEKDPQFFSFVLTLESGTKLYGGALHIYDELVTPEEFVRRARSAEEEANAAAGGKKRGSPSRSSSSSPSGENLDKEGGLLESPSSSLDPDVVMLPKCLVVLSHYAFHDVWRKFLQQLYRISLVEAPLPIERYIANFVREVPLPPKGRVEVKFSITDDLPLVIGRPPRNRLPLAGSSYRPLFTCLSVSNVIVVVGCLLQENRVALCAQQTSLLASVSEALVSLLFPFVWQGVYIPVMPSSMLDILDAPVPFLVGVHSRYLVRNKPQYRPRGVVFVDLDNDVVHLGFEDSLDGEYGKPTPKLPEKEAAKLKTALEDHGGVAYLSTTSGRKGRITYGHEEDMENPLREAYAQETAVVWSSSSGTGRNKQQILSGLVRTSVMSKIDRAYPADEHMVPVTSFITDKGSILHKDIVRHSRGGGRSGMAGIYKKSSREDEHPEAAGARGKQLNNLSLLDQGADESHGFSAVQIRTAFLRFFVSVFRNYDKFINTLDDEDVFAREEFLRKSDHLNPGCHVFLSAVLSSQMFQRFIEERLTDADQPEIKFFDESIVAKKNRSAKTTLRNGKKETPFLADDSDAVREVYVPPPPSNWGLPDDGRVYHYASFPELDDELFGKIRAPRQWDQDLTQRWVSNPSVLEHKLVSNLFLSSPTESPDRDLVWAIHVMAYKAFRGDKESPKGTGGKKGKSNPVSKSMIPVALGLLSATRRKQNRKFTLISKAQAVVRMYLEFQRSCRMRRAAVSIQRLFRKIQTRRRYGRGATRLFVRARHIQRLYRGRLARKLAEKRWFGVIQFQRLVRGWLVRCYMEDLNVWALTLQSILRGRRIRFAYRTLKDLVARAQACVRGFLIRRNMVSLLEDRIGKYRAQIFQLWRRACTPLCYRSKFWTFVDGIGFLQLALHEDELVKLWKELGLRELELDRSGRASTESVSPARDSKSYVASKSVRSDKLSDFLGRRSAAVFDRYFIVRKKLLKVERNDSLELIPVFPCEVGSILANPGKKSSMRSRKEAMLAANRQLHVERAELYEKLKFSTNDSTRSGLYALFNIAPSAKKKKQTVVEHIWEHVDFVEASYQVVLLNNGGPRATYQKSKRARKIFNVGSDIAQPISRVIEEQSTKAVQDKVQKRLERDVVVIVRSCILAMQALVNLTMRPDAAAKASLHQRKAITDGMDGDVWFDHRAIIIGEYLACGSKSPYLTSSRKRLRARASTLDGTVPVQMRLPTSFIQRKQSKKDGGEIRPNGSPRHSAEQAEARSSRPFNNDTEQSKRTNFVQERGDTRRDSFDRLMDSSIRSRLDDHGSSSIPE